MNEFRMGRYAPYLSGYQAGGKQGGGINYNPFWQAQALQAGGDIVGGLGDALFKSGAEKDAEWGRNQLKGMFGKPVFDPRALATTRENAFRAAIKPIAHQADQRFGLDDARAYNEIMWQYGNLKGNWLADMIAREGQLRRGYDTQIAGALAGGG